MDKIARLRQELDNRYQEYRAKMKTEDFTYYEGMADALDLFEQFLDTLSDEPDKSLEKAAEKWCKENGRGFVLRDKSAYYIGETLPAFKAGAEWQKEQMMQGAVEAEVIVPIYEGNDVWSAEIKIPGRYDLCDKVKVIVIKED